MVVSSPMSAQANGEPAAIVPATIQMPKAMIPTEIKNENENVAFMLASIPKKSIGLVLYSVIAGSHRASLTRHQASPSPAIWAGRPGPGHHR